jgi:hypothetical protein
MASSRKLRRFSGTISPLLAVAAIWFACAVSLLLLYRTNILSLTFMDTDDAMRLQQVRDWINGQGWFDVTQYRINPPVGGPMHWSRLVDLPIAAAILMARPLIGSPAAEILACAIIPMVTLALLFFALFRVSRLLMTPQLALLSILLLAVTPTILIQFTPMRIDHHGWQIVMATLALGGALDPRKGRGGMMAGVAIAAWLQISTEALPYAATFGALFVLRYAMDEREGVRLTGFASMLGGAAIALLLATHGTGALYQSQCDALSAVYAWPLAFFGVIIMVGTRLPRPGSFWSRLVIPAVGAGAALGTSLWLGADCLTAGPFHELTPLAYEQWYMRVMEGRPLWEQVPAMAGVSLLPSLIGLGSTLVAAAAAHEREAKARWLVMAVVLTGAILVSAMVMRAMTVAHVFALPGIAFMLVAAFRYIQHLRLAVLRVCLSSLLALFTPVGTAAAWSGIAEVAEPTRLVVKDNCRLPSVLGHLRALPPSLLFAPLDIGPDILVYTRHSVVGTGHHRNVIGINSVTHAFVSPPDAARADIMAANGGRGAQYLVMCPRMNEMLIYAHTAPNGLAAQLAKGKPPVWLQPVPITAPLRLYRITSP